MFLKRTRSKNFTYLSIAETYREDGQVKHRTLLQLGREDALKENSVLQGLVESIARVGGVAAGKDGGIRIADLEEEGRHNWGAVKVYRALWDMFDLDKIIKESCRSKKRRFDLPATIFSAVVARLIRPSSKLKVYERQHAYLGLKEVELEHLYRAMTHLGQGKDLIEQRLFERQKNLFNLQVDVVLYDVTTLYFESVLNDELRDFGYSKDAKFGEVQVVLGLIVDMEGRPIGFDIFPGNTFEGHTLIAALKKLRSRFDIRQIIIVADRGLNSKLNLLAIKQAGFDYIVGTRLKNLGSLLQKEILNQTQYTPLKKDENNEIELAYRAIDYQNIIKVTNADGSKTKISLPELLLCTWSKQRARKDKHDRDRLIERALTLLSTPSKISVRRGPRRFITTDNNETHFLDNERIQEDQQWDGFYAIQSSRKDLDPNFILETYHSLWKIEESFRVVKHTLQTRPIFHWKPHRIKGHLVLCFIAFLLERTLEIALRKRCPDASTDNIREALASLQVSTLKADSVKLYLCSKVTGLANDILRTLKIAVPKNLADSPPV